MSAINTSTYDCGPCDKCRRPVPAQNNAVLLAAIIESNPLMAFVVKARHLLPVTVDDEVVCEGSPSRAQYLEGQPRDTRGYEYRPGREAPIRTAYDKLLKHGIAVEAN